MTELRPTSEATIIAARLNGKHEFVAQVYAPFARKLLEGFEQQLSDIPSSELVHGLATRLVKGVGHADAKEEDRNLAAAFILRLACFDPARGYLARKRAVQGGYAIGVEIWSKDLEPERSAEWSLRSIARRTGRMPSRSGALDARSLMGVGHD